MAKENQIVLDLGENSLTDKQLKSLQKALHKTVVKKLTDSKAIATKQAESKPISKGIATAPDKGKTAELQVDFLNSDTGLNELTAIYNGTSKTLNQSGSISFDGLKKRDFIDLEGFGPGKKIITITGVNASPMQFSFAEGQNINGSFLIKE